MKIVVHIFRMKVLLQHLFDINVMGYFVKSDGGGVKISSFLCFSLCLISRGGYFTN